MKKTQAKETLTKKEWEKLTKLANKRGKRYSSAEKFLKALERDIFRA